MLDLWTALPTSILAFATTIHLAMIVLRKHRTPPKTFPWAILPSVAFGAGPWVFPTLAGTAIGLVVHGAWFAVCEALIPSSARQSATPVSSAQPPAASPRPAPVSGAASKDFVAVPVLAVFDESPTIRTFRLERPPGFTFQAGQFLTVRVQVDGKPCVRCYSISSAPEATGYLEISVKRHGLVSGMLHATVRPGSPLTVRPPAGKFTYPGQDDRPIVLVAGGVGITPLMSMLRHAIAANPTRPVTLLYSARNEEELAFWDELGWLARRHTHVRVVATLTASGTGWAGHVGRIDAAFLTKHAANAAQTVFMICGPAEMIRDVRLALEGGGVPAGQIRSEVFQAATAVGARLQDGGAAAEPEEKAPRLKPTLSLVKSNRTVAVDGQQTLLDAAEAAGVTIPSICRAGVCRTCRTRLVSGHVQCTSDALDETDRAEGWTLPCVAWTRHDCSLDA